MPPDSPRSSIVDAINAGVIVLDAGRRVVLWNQWIALSSGIAAEAARGKSLAEIFPGADVGILERAATSAIEAGASALITHSLHPELLPLKTRAGAALIHDVMVTAIVDRAERQCLIQLVDVTIAAKRERFLRDRQNARYNALMESAPDAIMTLDEEGVIQLVNPAVVLQFGYGAEELIGRKAATLFGSSEQWAELWRQVKSDHPALRPLELVVNRKDGLARYYEVSASRWRDGSRIFVTTMLRDVNDRRAAEAALRQSEEQSRANAQTLAQLNEVLRRSSEALNESARRKDEFLAILAHELRNPLAPLRNGLNLIKLLRDKPAAMEETREMMDRQLSHMVRLIDDLMDISRINRDKIELSKVTTPLASIISQAVETSRPLIDSRQHKLSIDLPREEVLVEVDVVRLVQVFANLLNNAAKYTPNGGDIRVVAVKEGERVIVRVRDNGVGIPPQMLSSVFDLFMQIDYSLRRSQGGLGIGLSLVRRLVEMHDGTVEAHSQGPGQGSEFVVSLPTARVRAQPAARTADEPRKPVRGRRILVADDNADSASSLAMLLNVMGHETKAVNDGLAALELADRFKPEVVLLDIGMPGLNGLDAARRLRERPWSKNVLLIALTGLGQEQDRLRSEEAGFDAHLVKPVDGGVLDTLLSSWRYPD